MAAIRKAVLSLSLIAAVAVAALFVWQRQHKPKPPDITRDGGTATPLEHHAAEQRAKPPDITRDGGTVFVYEIDEARLRGEDKVDPNYLAEAVRRRLDAAGLSGITVRPVGDTRVEITIPRGSGDHRDAVASAKDMIPRVGTLELCIVANADDDREVFDSVRHSPEELKKLKAAAISNRAPPAPRPLSGQAFATALGNFTYSWIELSPAELLFYDLLEAADPKPFWKEVETARNNHKPVLYAGSGVYRTNLLYSRNVQNPERLPYPEHDKKYEYFILCRDSERDEEGRSKAVTGKYLSEAYPTIDARTDAPAIGFKFNDQGAELLAALTKKNKGRQMAIVLDDRIQSAPNIEVPITGGLGIITGKSTRVEVELMVTILRSGALPAPLKLLPVSETTVEPSK